MNERHKILLIDDSPIVRAVVVHALSAAGFDVDTLEDPRAVEHALSGQRPDLLLFDATFPGISDDDLLEILSRHVPSLPVVIFSDRAESELRELVTRSGARGFVPKDGATLADRLTKLLAPS